MGVMIGLDTGGAYTDAVAFDAALTHQTLHRLLAEGNV